MKVGFIRVVENTRLYGNTYITWFSSPELMRGAAPGQFLMLRCADLMAGASESPSAADLADDPLLPRAMSYHRIREGEDGPEFAILYDVVGRGTAWLARRESGRRRSTPGGRWGAVTRCRAAGEDRTCCSSAAASASRRCCGWRTRRWRKGHSVVLLDGARDAEGVFPAELIPSEVGGRRDDAGRLAGARRGW